ncbi:MAG: hypothetical protein EPO32_13705 [Anaerolineae bacterium]|nr:MAG: hypothetical protein EPO32_13705 [Anaerolineae bacterium]
MDYRQYNKGPEERKGIHPAWRGIGCLMMLIIPVVGFASSDLIIRFARANVAGFFVPTQLRGNLTLPGYGVVVDFWAVMALTLIVSIVLFALLAVLNAIVYGMSGKTKRNFESAPQRHKPKRKLK